MIEQSYIKGEIEELRRMLQMLLVDYAILDKKLRKEIQDIVDRILKLENLL